MAMYGQNSRTKFNFFLFKIRTEFSFYRECHINIIAVTIRMELITRPTTPKALLAFKIELSGSNFFAFQLFTLDIIPNPKHLFKRGREPGILTDFCCN